MSKQLGTSETMRIPTLLTTGSDCRVEVQCLHVIRKRSGKKKVKYVTNFNVLLHDVNI